MRGALIGCLLLAIGGAVGAQQPAAFVARAPASATSVRHSKLPLAEQMRRRPDILTGDAINDVASEFATGRHTLGETVLMSSDMPAGGGGSPVTYLVPSLLFFRVIQGLGAGAVQPRAWPRDFISSMRRRTGPS